MKHLSFNWDLGSPRTLIVLGVGRGGTSVVAGTLRCLGVCMGVDPHPVKHEWSPVVYKMNQQVEVGATARNIEQMNLAHGLWGWKSPADLFALDTILPLLRSPAFLIVTRDLVAVTLSSESYGQTPAEIGFYESATVYQMIAARLRFWPYPAAVVPFQEILDKAEEFVEFLCSYLQITPTAEQTKMALAFNCPGPNAYRTVDSNFPTTISPGDLQKDVNDLASLYIARYAEEYRRHFSGMKADAEKALGVLCQHLTNVPNDDITGPIIGGMRQAFARFASDLRGAEGPPATSGRLNPAHTTGLPAIREMLSSIVDAAEKVGELLKQKGLASTEGYRLLRQLRRIFLLLISVRTELQKGLQILPAPAS